MDVNKLIEILKKLNIHHEVELSDSTGNISGNGWDVNFDVPIGNGFWQTTFDFETIIEFVSGLNLYGVLGKILEAEGMSLNLSDLIEIFGDKKVRPSVISDLFVELGASKIKEGEKYFYLTDTGEIFDSVWVNDAVDRKRIVIGNVYKSESECEKARGIKTIEKLMINCGGKRTPWESKDNYVIVRVGDEIGVDIVFKAYRQGSIYFRHRHEAEDAISKIGKTRLMKLFEN